MADATLAQVVAYFRGEGDTLKSIRDEWSALSDADKADIKRGIGDGTFNY